LCHGRLAWAVEIISCTGCGQRYPIIEGIPVFADPAADHWPGDAHKRGQMEHFDDVLAEFEIERPHKTTALYRWLMDEKHRRALRDLGPLLPGLTALTVCGGSGMDGEYLARAGAKVIVSDISLGAAFRARERARRYALDMVVIVADAERLPFADGGVGVALVHDGLHHLDDPRRGILEIARVAGTAVSITEPARAAATDVAVRLGIARNYEAAGNRVERLDPAEAEQRLTTAGFRVLRNERYAMYYKHHPPRLSRILSLPPLLAILRVIFSTFNSVMGGVGNKLAIQAVRDAGVGVRDRAALESESASTGGSDFGDADYEGGRSD
jgi:ubiquinone/menaquinone biosynthesis C-methylase UbiE